MTGAALTAVIVEPSTVVTLTQGQTLRLAGASVGGAGFNEGTFLWTLDEVPIGTERVATATLEAIGNHTIVLEVAEEDLVGRAERAVVVLPDFDRDGIANETEKALGLNPLDPWDAAGDPDADGLSTLHEFNMGTNPSLADTDGDGFPDPDELAQGSDPADPDSLPPTGPLLQVGADMITLEATAGEPALFPAETWVTHAGPVRSLAWTATTDAPWLGASPTGSSTPSQLTLHADATALTPGGYTGVVTVTAAEALNSPRRVTVRLRVRAPASPPSSPSPPPTTEPLPSATPSPTLMPTLPPDLATATPEPTGSATPEPTAMATPRTTPTATPGDRGTPPGVRPTERATRPPGPSPTPVGAPTQRTPSIPPSPTGSPPSPTATPPDARTRQVIYLPFSRVP